MDLRQIRYFVALAEELHFHRAAERLSISQPPLSLAIRQLEDDLGTALFKRTTKSVSLTAAGVEFYQEALRLLALLDQACKNTRAVGDGLKGQVTVGFVGGMLLRGIPETILKFNQENAYTQIGLQEMSSANQIQALLHGQLSAGFLHASALPQGLESVLISSEPFVLCLNAKHPFANKLSVHLSALANEDMIIFSREASPSYYDSVISMCASANFSPNVRHNVTHWLTALLMVSKGLGVAVVPQAFVKSGMTGVKFVKLKGGTGVSLAHFSWKKNNGHPALTSFINFVLQKFCIDSTTRLSNAISGRVDN